MEAEGDGEKDILGFGRWQQVALGQLERLRTEGLLKLTYPKPLALDFVLLSW